MSKIQSTPILNKFFTATRPLVSNYPASYRGQVIGRVDDKLYLANVFDENGNVIVTLSLSSQNMHGWSWQDTMPVGSLTLGNQLISLNKVSR